MAILPQSETKGRCWGENPSCKWEKTKERQKDKGEEGNGSAQEKCQNQTERQVVFPRKVSKCKDKGRTQRAGESKIAE